MTEHEAIELCKEYIFCSGDAETKFRAAEADFDRRGEGGRWKYVLSKIDSQKFNAFNDLLQQANED